MKQKTTFITIALVVAILALGIAYAAITTQNLNVTGSVGATTTDANFDVSFVTADITPTVAGDNVDDEETTITKTASASGKTGTITIAGLNTAGQEVTTVFSIKNNSTDLNAKLEIPSINGIVFDNTDWYEVTAELGSSTLAPGATTTLTVKVKLIKTPATAADIEAATETFVVNFTADAYNAE